MKLFPPRKIALIAAILGALVTTNAVAQVAADTYPGRQIRFVLPFVAGGPTDVLARTVAQKLSENWQQPVVVDNRAGAGGTIGADFVAKSAPDGYTLLFATAGVIAVNPGLYSKLPYDTVKDFAPVTLVAKVDSVLVVHPSLPVKTFGEFVRLVKARPGELNYASSGNGSGAHLSMEMLKSAANIQIQHVPYKGAAPGITDLLGGRVEAMLVGLPAVMPQIKTGKLRALAIGGLQRSPFMPDLPTFAQSGLPGFEATTWFGILAPAATPKNITSKLNGELVKLLRSPELKERLSTLAYEPTGSTQEQFVTYLAAEMTKWARVIKESGATAD
ncbi:MAG: tripartite tricarboxylate transporter substrate binding protein [Burkholderiales bacterium]|nr:tripartite tricarboxylate transporter substrate binding protein [Burkholderiales bacterium]